MIEIGYSGTLSYYHPKVNNGVPFWRKIIKSYRHHFELSATRSPYFLFQAINLLKEKDEHLCQKLKVSLWGSIDERNYQLVNELNLLDIVFIEGNYSKKESFEKLRNCDVLFLPIEKSPENHQTLFIPGKVFEYLELRKPILILNTDSDCAQLVKKSGLGIFAESENIENIAATILNIIQHPENLKMNNAVNEEYILSRSFKYRAKEMADVFDNLLK
jgi:glycosyltransferase involved in cell wall biosynthesis